VRRKRKTALITGNLGFVGRHFQSYLEKTGWDAYGFDIRGPLPIDAIKFFQTVEVKFDLAIHCAATIPPIDQRKHNDMPVAQDFAIDSMFFQWALRNPPTKIVYFSSSAAYPISIQRYPAARRLGEDSIDLDNLACPDAMYGLTKLTGEVQAREAKRQGLDILVLRPFSGYGTDQSVDYPFTAFLDRAMKKTDPFPVWGTGDQVRDFIHIDDIVAAVMAMLEANFQGPVNLGTGVPTSLLTLAEMVTTAFGYKPKMQTRSEKPTGAFYRCANPDLMFRYYQPKVTLEEGIRRAMKA
jgi:nucleoside-diphosphate-sugar epimerase